MDRRLLLLQPRQLALQVAHEQVGEVVGEAAPDDDPKRYEVLRFFGNVYAGTCHPRSRSAFETSTLEAEVLDEVRIEEPRDEGSRGTIDVNGNRYARLAFEGIERGTNLFHRLGVGPHVGTLPPPSSGVKPPPC